MFFEMDTTVFYIVLLVAAQIMLAGIIILVWLFRGKSSGVRSDKAQPASSYGLFRLLRFFSAGTAGLVLVGLLVYLFFRPTPSEVTVYHRTPEVTPSTDTPLDDNPREKEQGTLGSAYDEPWRAEKGAADSLVRETVRKGLQGELPSPALVRDPIRNPSLHTYMNLVNSWLDDASKANQSSPPTVDSLYDRMVQEYGFAGPKSLLLEYINTRQATRKETDPTSHAFLQPGCGKEADVRWWSQSVFVSGEETKVYFFSMQSKWSRALFVKAFAEGSLQTFMDAHLQAFRHFGGIFPQINYLDVSLPVSLALNEENAEASGQFALFAAHYNFKSTRATPPNQPENPLDKRLSELNSCATVEDLNERLREVLLLEEANHGEKSDQLFQAERLCLLNLPKEPFAASMGLSVSHPLPPRSGD